MFFSKRCAKIFSKTANANASKSFYELVNNNRK